MDEKARKLLLGDLQVGDLQVGDLQVGDLQVGDLQVGDLQVGDLQVGELQERPWATHSQRAEFLSAILLGMRVSEATICRTIKRLSHGRKRSRGAAERDEFLRLLWRMEIGRVDPRRLVLVDEMNVHISLAPLYAYASIGERAFLETPRNRGTNTTLLSSLHPEGMGPSMAVEGVTTKEVFETYVEHFLAAVLKPGQEVVVIDNLGAHRPRRVRELIGDKGCQLLYLPPYSPDLNPIEEELLIEDLNQVFRDD